MTGSQELPNGEKLIDSFDKNPTRQVRASLREYNGGEYVHFRFWGIWGDSEEYRPTKQGLAIPVELFPKFKQLVLKAEKALAELE